MASLLTRALDLAVEDGLTDPPPPAPEPRFPAEAAVEQGDAVWGGYDRRSAGDLACDQEAAEALGLPPDRPASGVAVYFEDEAGVRAFLPAYHPERVVGVARVTLFCLDWSVPVRAGSPHCCAWTGRSRPPSVRPCAGARPRSRRPGGLVFVQVIKGRVRDAAEVRRVFDRWYDELSPGAQGWLGSTAGVADDGTLLATARFESEGAARRNSERPEQGQWWSEASGVFTGPVEFHDCAEVIVGRGGGSDRAGFVQVIEGRTTDLARSRELAREWDRIVEGRRPELLGTLIALHAEDGRFTQLAYFTSEVEARAGERDQPPPPPELVEARSLLEDVTFLDLRDPWLRSPR